jgi:hypothetical protein
VIALLDCSRRSCLFFVASSGQRNQVFLTLDGVGMAPSSILQRCHSVAIPHGLSLVRAGILKLIVTTHKVDSPYRSIESAGALALSVLQILPSRTIPTSVSGAGTKADGKL